MFDRELVISNPAFAVGRAALAVLDAGREGLATWAVATDDCAAEVARLRAAGSRIGVPVAGSRTRPDGEVVRWVTAFPALGPDEPPFLIEHELAGAEWGPEARAARAAFRHPGGGALRLASLVVPVADPTDRGAAYRDVLGLAADGGRVALGGQTVLLPGLGERRVRSRSCGLPRQSATVPRRSSVSASAGRSAPADASRARPGYPPAHAMPIRRDFTFHASGRKMTAFYAGPEPHRAPIPRSPCRRTQP